MMDGDSEVAQGWLNHTQDDRLYIGFRIDDPGFVAPIYPACTRARTATVSTSTGRGRRSAGTIEPASPARQCRAGVIT